MGSKFSEITFTDSVKSVQTVSGSRQGYERLEQRDDSNQLLDSSEASFISASDSFYMATVSETGWPYVQHRGGPKGFVRVLDERTLGFADFRGNRQYISVGNLMADDRVSLFFMDYANKKRLKLLGRARLVDLEESAVLQKLELPDYRARVERGFIITVEAYDWNCPQHITPRYSVDEIADLTRPLQLRIEALEKELATDRGQ